MKKTLIFSSFLMAMTACYASDVLAQEVIGGAKAKEILFKIHDIKPNKDKDGLVKDCDYIITFYNRTDFNIDSASIDLSWLDNTGNYVIEQNQKDIASELSEASAENAKAEGKIKAETKNVNTFVEVPSILAYSQISLASKIKTEKCFLLLENVKYTVTSCELQLEPSEEDIVPASRRAPRGKDKNESCARLFKFVSTQDPEYYRDFKPISFEEEQVSASEKQRQDLEAIATKGNDIVSDLGKATGILGEIRQQ